MMGIIHVSKRDARILVSHYNGGFSQWLQQQIGIISPFQLQGFTNAPDFERSKMVGAQVHIHDHLSKIAEHKTLT